MKTDRRNVLGILTGAAGAALLPGVSLADGVGQVAASAKGAEAGTSALPKERVTGIGGFFFRAHDPKGLAQWYQDHLGVLLTPQKHGDPSWQQEAGPMAFQPFKETTGYFGDPSKMWMLNLRVRSLDAMVAQLTAAGIVVKVDAETYPNGRFAHTHDPEGNPIELWEPSAASLGQ
jgi:catechol 2,3-dioxygenase-like lactoylglutathione lyase family enzyme